MIEFIIPSFERPDKLMVLLYSLISQTNDNWIAHVVADAMYDGLEKIINHFDGNEKIYYKHQITDADKANKYITLPDNIIGAVSIFSIGDPSVRADDLFSIRYQIALNDLYTLTSVSLIPYYMTMQHLSVISEMLVGKQPIRYNRLRNQLYVDMDWNTVITGEYLLVEAYQVVDPDEFTDAWGERWLQNYATALIKKQWGNNLKKFTGMQLPGGIQFNGQQIYDEANAEIIEMERDMVMNLSLPALDMIG
jgi:hypothetical protein